jgi:hypothetical protein
VSRQPFWFQKRLLDVGSIIGSVFVSCFIGDFMAFVSPSWSDAKMVGASYIIGSSQPVGDIVYDFISDMKPWPNQSPEPTPIGHSSAVAIHVTQAWLSFFR